MFSKFRDKSTILFYGIIFRTIHLFTLGEGDKRRIRDLEGRLVNAEAANSSLQRKCDAFSDVKANLENEVTFVFWYHFWHNPT